MGEKKLEIITPLQANRLVQEKLIADKIRDNTLQDYQLDCVFKSIKSYASMGHNKIRVELGSLNRVGVQYLKDIGYSISEPFEHAYRIAADNYTAASIWISW